MRARVQRILAIFAVALLAGCETLGYYAQAVGGHFDVLARARPLEDLMSDPATPEDLRARLKAARAIRAFASAELGLPDNGSYQRYAELGRAFVVWNVVAAPEFSTKAVRSCFPVAGCVTYRGFFAEADANAHAAKLRGEGLDVRVVGVPAYSTLGWFDDPLLSSFIRYPESELARLVFHELAHQVVYARGDTVFNESFAVAVEREGVRRWLVAQGRVADLQSFYAARERQREFIGLIEGAKAKLDRAYASGGTPLAMREAKRAGFAELERDYVALKSRWGGFAGYDRIIGGALNNALLASISAYSMLVPGFERLLAESGADLPRFYAAAARLAQMTAEDRLAALRTR